MQQEELAPYLLARLLHRPAALPSSRARGEKEVPIAQRVPLSEHGRTLGRTAARMGH